MRISNEKYRPQKNFSPPISPSPMLPIFPRPILLTPCSVLRCRRKQVRCLQFAYIPGLKTLRKVRKTPVNIG